MAEYNSTQREYQLNIDAKYYNALDVRSFLQMLKDPSYCYKFYWLEAIVNLISEDVRDTTFDAVIDEMVHEKDIIHSMYEKCFRDNLHSIWANQELYRPGNTKDQFMNILDSNMCPVYQSARRQGYELWEHARQE